jgi:cyanophycin synthetase
VGLKRFIDRRRPLRIAAYRAAVRLLVRPYIAALGVPVVAVTGTNGKSTVTKLIAHLLRASGRRVGTCTTDGVCHDGGVVTAHDEAGAGGAWRAARCPGVEALVLETARGGLLQYGAGFRRCDVGVVTNVGDDHLGEYGVGTVEQMARVKAEVVRRTHRAGTVVLNADDPLVRGMEAETSARVVPFTVEGGEGAFRRGWFLRAGSVWRRDASGERPFMDVGEIPIACGGLQRHNVANALAALAAIEGLGPRTPVDWRAVAGALRTFGNDPRDNLRRNTLLVHRGVHLLLSQCKNPESARLEAPLLARLRAALGPGNTVGVLSAPGGRPEGYYHGISRAVAPLCDRFYVRPPAEHYLRGMAPERIVELLSSAIGPERIATPADAPLAEVAASAGRRGPALVIVFLGVVERGLDVGGLLASSRAVSLAELLREKPGAR